MRKKVIMKVCFGMLGVIGNLKDNFERNWFIIVIIYGFRVVVF